MEEDGVERMLLLEKRYHSKSVQKLRKEYMEFESISRSKRKIIEKFAFYKLFEYNMLCREVFWCFKIKSLERIGAVGLCEHKKQTIYIDREILQLCDINKLKEIVLHELSHALTLPSMGHNKVWRAVYKTVGGNMKLAPKI
jgi:hypothetical protein